MICVKSLLYNILLYTTVLLQTQLDDIQIVYLGGKAGKASQDPACFLSAYVVSRVLEFSLSYVGGLQLYGNIGK